ncbi:MAG: 5-formyltetrahydrofolate cyclo-ligase [Bacteroidota bacterium]
MDKVQLRKYYLSKRKAISSEEIAEKSQQIADLFFQSFDLSNIQKLHIFLPIIRNKEINTFLIIKHLNKHFPQINIIIPKTIISTSEMEHYLLDEEKLTENQWGILEPSDENLVKFEPSTIDLVIIPLLVFDKHGNRVGYGKGFYDRFLQKCKTTTLKIGLCLEEPIEQIEDVNEFDIKMDFCITSTKNYIF